VSLRAVDAPVSYAELAPRIAAVVEEQTPVGAIVLVVSKGDESLVRFEGRSGWHFPRAAGGQYAGHHPIDGNWAVEHLEGLRSAGGAYLVLPSTYYWWFEHYPELERHLGARYDRVQCPEEVCRLYRLLETPAMAPRAVPGLWGSEEQRRCLPAMRALVCSLLPEEEVVLVVSEGDDSLLALDRPAWHFPHDPEGMHQPLAADADGYLVTQLQTLSRNGIRFLLVPVAMLWTLARRPALAAYLSEDCRRLALREGVCALYELRTRSRSSNPTSLRPKEAAWK